MPEAIRPRAARPTHPLRETGFAFVIVGIVLWVVSVIAQLNCGIFLFSFFCVAGLFPVATVFCPILIVVGYAVTRYHRPPNPSEIPDQPAAMICPSCGRLNPRPSSGFCFHCGRALPSPY